MIFPKKKLEKKLLANTSQIVKMSKTFWSFSHIFNGFWQNIQNIKKSIYIYLSLAMTMNYAEVEDNPIYSFPRKSH